MASYLKGIGDALNGSNEILPSFDAKIYNYLTQNEAGIVGTEPSKFPLTVIDRGVQIGAGMVHAMGYFGMTDSPTQLNFVYPTGSPQYARIYAEINLSVTPHQFKIKSTAQSSTTNIALIQDDLKVAPSGIHQIPLYLLTINPNNTITSVDQRAMLSAPQRAMNADNVTGTIAGRAISNIFESNHYVKSNHGDKSTNDSLYGICTNKQSTGWNIDNL